MRADTLGLPLVTADAAPTACDRCGSFGPLAPSWGRMLCEACLARRHPAETEPFTIDSLIGWSLKLCAELGRQLLPWLAVAAVVDGLEDVAVEHLFAGHGLLSTMVTLALNAATSDLIAPFTALVVLRYLERGERMDAGRAWAELRPRLRVLIAVNLAVNTLITLGLLACILPGLALSALMLVATPIALREPADTSYAMRASSTRIRPVFWHAFGANVVLLLPTLLIVIAGSFAVEATQAPRTLNALLMGAGFVAWLPALVLAAVAYAKLIGAEGAKRRA